MSTVGFRAFSVADRKPGIDFQHRSGILIVWRLLKTFENNFFIIRLHRMHDRQTIVTDVCVPVCQSVRPSISLCHARSFSAAFAKSRWLLVYFQSNIHFIVSRRWPFYSKRRYRTSAVDWLILILQSTWFVAVWIDHTASVYQIMLNVMPRSIHCRAVSSLAATTHSHAQFIETSTRTCLGVLHNNNINKNETNNTLIYSCGFGGLK